MYRESARVYDAMCRHKDYRGAARTLHELLQRLAPQAESLLDVGCGTGRHLAHLRKHYRVEGLDLSAEMLKIARKRCPDVPFHLGTLGDFQLPDRFDVVTCLFGSIGYALHLDGLRCAVRCMSRHLRDGGALIIEPWLTPDRFIVDRLVLDTVDDPELKAARLYVTKRRDRVSVFDSQFIVGTPAGVDSFSERQELGLFTDEEYRAAIRAAGLTLAGTGPELFGYGLYVCLARAPMSAERVVRSDEAPDMPLE